MAALKARVAAAIGTSKAKGGLNVGLHPALEDLGQWKPTAAAKPADSRLAMGSAGKLHSEQTRISAGSRTSAFLNGQGGATGANPYLETATPGVSAGKQRMPRQLAFNQKGKYIQQANALRRQAALEAMKKRIAEQTRKAGIDEDLGEKNFVVEAPPEIEWWDEALVTSYDTLDDPSSLKIQGEDTIVTNLIQHPVALEPPQERNAPAPKPMYLTSKEQAKIRRQNRMADLKEQQAKIRLGLIPAPPPKVKKGNLMRVLGEEAVKDPTAVEAMVNQQIAERHQKHLQTNEERKLTKEQKHEKLAANQEKDAAKSLHLLVFKIGSLANGQHRFKIQKNAEQLALTGICVMHPRFNLIVAEGGQWSTTKYKKLMMNRIDWTENVPSRDAKQGQQREWLMAEDDKGGLKDMTSNYCKLVFEGEVKTRAFKRWTSKVAETDAEARDALARSKMDNFWSTARSML
ncbi:Pre-mRNA-splicing factor 3 [Cryphonectria parasitica EP155]|uniref:Pre-mRNA-splicing factor 3 n=1 Tax=Cryphonectria parasitica (strain ATCC 38755 / EP155) TaxID=660469 RepID=A0A9P4Y2T1_CRYP1|nr:Pre-mRNA-splicing factor 3 [Cryphonectria parasitica EP155]KAF3765924.1 Pre-mRNA-splicing factor 3 [Cryphonectria parasitica EP155]